MKLTLDRQDTPDEATIGTLNMDGLFQRFTLEDPHHDVKIPGETRIPAGTYQLRLREFGGFHERYSKKFPDMHLGMLEICDVPGFTDVLIHIGNSMKDTRGCVLVGLGRQRDRVTSSKLAYIGFYPKPARALAAGEEVTITITDLDR